MFIYILKLSDNTYYTGITNNITRRFKEHSNGRSISTRYKRPVILIYLREANDRKTARRIEVKIKGMGAKRFLQLKSTILSGGQLPH